MCEQENLGIITISSHWLVYIFNATDQQKWANCWRVGARATAVNGDALGLRKRDLSTNNQNPFKQKCFQTHVLEYITIEYPPVY